MKLFLDTAHVESIKKWSETGLLDGVTTNPTSLSKEAGLPTEVVKKISALLDENDVSVEVTERAPQAVYDQAKRITALADNIVVKIPCYTDYFPVIKKLVDEGIAINITLVFTAIQGLLMAKLGVLYVSPFIGRLEEIDIDGITTIAEMRDMFDRYDFETEILAASVRSVRHVHDVALAGADIATMSEHIFEEITKHPLTEKGMAKFEADWQKLGIRQFP